MTFSENPKLVDGLVEQGKLNKDAAISFWAGLRRRDRSFDITIKIVNFLAREGNEEVRDRVSKYLLEKFKEQEFEERSLAQEVFVNLFQMASDSGDSELQSFYASKLVQALESDDALAKGTASRLIAEGVHWIDGLSSSAKQNLIKELERIAGDGNDEAQGALDYIKSNLGILQRTAIGLRGLAGRLGGYFDLDILPEGEKSGENAKLEFKIGGTNSNAAIMAITKINERPIEEIEEEMKRPPTKYLAPDESLLEVLAGYNTSVLGEDYTHQQLAEWLYQVRDLIASAEKSEETPHKPETTFELHGKEYKGGYTVYMGAEMHPFEDAHSYTVVYWVQNVRTRKRIEFTELQIDMIKKYGFYRRRLDKKQMGPSDIITVMAGIPKAIRTIISYFDLGF